MLFVQVWKKYWSPRTSLVIGWMLFWHSCRQCFAEKQDIFARSPDKKNGFSLKQKHCSSKCSSAHVENCFDETTETAVPSFENNPLRHGKYQFIKFLTKTKPCLSMLFGRNWIFFPPKSANNVKFYSFFSIKEVLRKLLLTSSMQFWDTWLQFF